MEVRIEVEKKASGTVIARAEWEVFKRFWKPVFASTAETAKDACLDITELAERLVELYTATADAARAKAKEVR